MRFFGDFLENGDGILGILKFLGESCENSNSNFVKNCEI